MSADDLRSAVATRFDWHPCARMHARPLDFVLVPPVLTVVPLHVADRVRAITTVFSLVIRQRRTACVFVEIAHHDSARDARVVAHAGTQLATHVS